MFFSLIFKFGRVGTLVGRIEIGFSLRIELSFKVGRVGTLGGRVRVGTLGGGLGTLGVNLNLVSSSSSKLRLRLRLSFIIGRVGTLGGRAGYPGGGQGWGPVYHPVHAMFPGAHLDTRRAGTFQIPVHAMFPGAHLETPQGWDNNNNIGGLPVNH